MFINNQTRGNVKCGSAENGNLTDTFKHPVSLFIRDHFTGW